MSSKVSPLKRLLFFQGYRNRVFYEYINSTVSVLQCVVFEKYTDSYYLSDLNFLNSWFYSQFFFFYNCLVLVFAKKVLCIVSYIPPDVVVFFYRNITGFFPKHSGVKGIFINRGICAWIDEGGNFCVFV